MRWSTRWREEAANEIGENFKGVANKLAHLVAGCATGALNSGNSGGCAAGGVGAVVGEMMAEAMGGSPAMDAFYSDQNKVYLSGLLGGLAVALVGGDQEQIATGNWAGSNAAANNYLAHKERQTLKAAEAACFGGGNQGACDTANALKYKDEMTDRLLANAAASCTGNECNDVVKYVDKQIALLGCTVPAACPDDQTLLQFRRVAQEKAQGLEAVYPESWLLDGKAAFDLVKLGIKVATSAGNRGALELLDDIAARSAAEIQAARIETSALRDDFQQFDQYRKTTSTRPGGEWDWQRVAPNNGAVLGTEKTVTLTPGTQVDRYGLEYGTYLSPSGTPYEARALAPGSKADGYSSYTVQKPFKVESADVVSAFGQPGGGVQYRVLSPEGVSIKVNVDYLIKNGYLK